jgi:hypothetical protein
LSDVCDGEVCLDAEKGTRKREVRLASPPRTRIGCDLSYIVSTLLGEYTSPLHVDLHASATRYMLVI